jgi:hypothetical protein
VGPILADPEVLRLTGSVHTTAENVRPFRGAERDHPGTFLASACLIRNGTKYGVVNGVKYRVDTWVGQQHIFGEGKYWVAIAAEGLHRFNESIQRKEATAPQAAH